MPHTPLIPDARGGFRLIDSGFSLIEMMMVISVIAILALIALPTMMDKIVRDQITEALPLANLATGPVSAGWAASKSFPADNAAAGLPEADRIVSNWISSVAIKDGAVNLTFGNRANGSLRGKTLTLRPAVVEDLSIVPVSWVCGQAAAPYRMTLRGENRTNIPAVYLPVRCRP